MGADGQDDRPSLIPLVEFAINDPLGHGYTAFYADRGQHPRRPLSAPGSPPDDVGLGGDPLARHMAVVSYEIRGLLHESQAERKARLDPTRRDVRFKPKPVQAEAGTRFS